jgi:hypothetical protein
MVVEMGRPPGIAYTTGTEASQNSASTWRQPPHGDAGREVPPTTATASMRRAPCATAIPTAFRSAQTQSGNEPFSTLQAAWMRPFARTAAPTGKCEYGT